MDNMILSVMTSELIEHAQPILSRHNVASFANFVTDFRLVTLDAGDDQPRELHPATAVSADGSLKQLTTMRVLGISGSPTVQVSSGGGYSNFQNWLEALPTFPVSVVGEEAVTLQQDWWAANNKYFALADLPGELLHSIFFQVLQPRTNPRPAFNGADQRYWFGTGILQDDMRDNPEAHIEAAANRELLLVSKEVRETALEIVWIYSRQIFQSARDFHDFYKVHERLPYVTLNKICLDYSMEDWAVILGIPIHDQVGRRYTFHPRNPNRDHTLMELLPQLQDLQIYFRSPKHSSPPSWDCDALLERFPCQKVACNAVLVYAWQWIKDVGRLRLTGCIKDSTRMLWLERHRYYRFCGAEPNLKADERFIQEACEDDMITRCECSTQCMFERPQDDATDEEVIEHNRSYVWDPSG